MRERVQKRQPGAEHDSVRALMAEFSLEALRFIPQARISETVRQWLAHPARCRDDRNEARALADAVAFASDLALFMPSASGLTAIDRLARHRAPANRPEQAAIEALRQARFRVMRIEEREDRRAVRFRDLASGETPRVAEADLPDCCAGVSVTARTAPLGDGSYVLIGPITPLDEDARAVALGFRRADAIGLGNPQRCAEAVYRHVVRYGGLEMPGLNRPTDPRDENDEFRLGPEDSELDQIAHDWAKLDAGAALPAAALQCARDLTSIPAVLDALASSVLARQRRRDRLSDAYARVAAIQIETVRLREANGMSGISLAALAAAIATPSPSTACPRQHEPCSTTCGGRVGPPPRPAPQRLILTG